MRTGLKRLEVNNRLGESPVWHSAERAFYWLDVPQKLLYRWCLEDVQVSFWTLPEPVSSFAFTERGDLLLTPRWGFARYQLGDNEFTLVVAPEQHSPNRFNDGAVGPDGSFWACTLNESQAPSNTLYRLGPDGLVSAVDHGFRAGNGIAWSPDGHFMYLVDSGERVIYRYAFAAAGQVSNRIAWMRFGPDEGVPDGIAADANGNIWCALWSGGKVVRLSPAGHISEEIRLPMTHPTSCAFGGPRLETLFITSARPSAGRMGLLGDGDVHYLEVDVAGAPVALFSN